MRAEEEQDCNNCDTPCFPYRVEPLRYSQYDDDDDDEYDDDDDDYYYYYDDDDDDDSDDAVSMLTAPLGPVVVTVSSDATIAADTGKVRTSIAIRIQMNAWQRNGREDDRWFQNNPYYTLAELPADDWHEDQDDLRPVSDDDDDRMSVGTPSLSLLVRPGLLSYSQAASPSLGNREDTGSVEPVSSKQPVQGEPGNSMVKPRGRPKDSDLLPDTAMYAQDCKHCGTASFPYHVEPIRCSQCLETDCVCTEDDLEEKKRHVDPNKPHMKELCHKCLAGDPCT
nr:hypothetical protein BaRGS_029236 [Batillaria attramentaria]